MTITLESIYKVLNDFFLSNFQTDAGSAIQFRFDKNGDVLSDESFIDSLAPDFGYSPALAMEIFSGVVNRIPIDCGDGLNVMLSVLDTIDDTYFNRLLTPSSISIPNHSFFMTKEEALKRWENGKLESSISRDFYRPAMASPKNWYDKTDSDGWRSHSFEITEEKPSSSGSPSQQLWRLKLDDASKAAILNSAMKANTSISQPTPTMAAHLIPTDQNPLAAASSKQKTFNRKLPVGHNSNKLPEGRLDWFSLFGKGRYQLSVEERIKIARLMAEKASTRPVQTNHIQISFDYCLVKATRQWYFSPFIYDQSWHIPNIPKGQITMSGVLGSLSWLTIGCVAIRNFKLEGDWTQEDIDNAVQATHFGPFQFIDSIMNGEPYPDLQIIGWLLQDLPDLPPNEPPAS